MECSVQSVQFSINGQVAGGSHYARTMIFFSQAHILYISPLKPLDFGTLYPLKALVNMWKSLYPLLKEHSGAKLGGPAVIYLVVKYGD